MRLTAILQLTLLLGVAHARPQNLLSDIASAFGFGDDDKTTAGKTLVPPATATRSSKSTRSTITSRVRTTHTSSPSPTSSTETDTEETTSTSTVEGTTITPPPTPTPPPPPPPPPPPTNTPAPINNQPKSGVSGAGIAVAVIFTLVILGAIAFLLFRYHPGVRRWWTARQDKKLQERSYRDAIDGPFAGGGSGVASDTSKSNFQNRRTMLASFFAPRSVMLGNGKEIRRKPVNWGAGFDSTATSPHLQSQPHPRSLSRSHPVTAELPGDGIGMEKVALTNMAAPMARTESTKSAVSYFSTNYHLSSNSGGSGSGVSSMTSSPALPQKELPPMPPIPIPPVPAQPGQKNVHGILSRKSIYELA